MIREERDPGFWTSIYEHPAVKPASSLGGELDIAKIVANPAVTPFRADAGGYLFARMDGLGRVFDLHAMFRPEGWGRPAFAALLASTHTMFERGAEAIFATEVEGNRRSRPPLTFGFRPAGDFAEAPGFEIRFRTWLLTKPAWLLSPARQRII